MKPEISRRTLLSLGISATALALYADSRLKILDGYTPSVSEKETQLSFYRYGELSKESAFRYFSTDNDLFLQYYPAIDVPYANNWSFSRIMSLVIKKEQARSVLGKNHIPVFSSDLDRTIRGFSHYIDSERKNFIESSEKPVPPYSTSGSVYCDDNAWMMLNFIDIYGLFRNPSALNTAIDLFNFEISNWEEKTGCDPGGIPWKVQIPGELNHDRNVVSNAPVAIAGFKLYQLTHDEKYLEWAKKIYTYAMTTFLTKDMTVIDHIDKNCIPDKTFWSYTYGLMVGVNNLYSEVLKDKNALKLAEEIALSSLDTLENKPHPWQPPEFMDIYFNELKTLSEATENSYLKSEIRHTIITYAQKLWSNPNIHRNNHLFSFTNPPLLIELVHQAGVSNIFYTASMIKNRQ